MDANQKFSGYKYIRFHTLKVNDVVVKILKQRHYQLTNETDVREGYDGFVLTY